MRGAFSFSGLRAGAVRVHAPIGFFLAVAISRVLGIGLVCHARYIRSSRGFAKPAAHRRDSEEQNRCYDDRIEREGIHAGRIVTIKLPLGYSMSLVALRTSQCMTFPSFRPAVLIRLR